MGDQTLYTNTTASDSISADDIKNKFKSLQQRKPDTKSVSNILDTAKQREEIYTEEGKRRAEETKTAKEGDIKQSTSRKKTTITLSLSDLVRFMGLSQKVISENGVLNYEHIFKAGLDALEGLNEHQLIKKINKFSSKSE